MAGRRVDLSSRKMVPIMRLKLAVRTEHCQIGLPVAGRSEKAEGRCDRHDAVGREQAGDEAAKQQYSAPPPAPAAATKINTWVGVSAPTP
jgi:hypothetical protein